MSDSHIWENILNLVSAVTPAIAVTCCRQRVLMQVWFPLHKNALHDPPAVQLCRCRPLRGVCLLAENAQRRWGGACRQSSAPSLILRSAVASRHSDHRHPPLKFSGSVPESWNFAGVLDPHQIEEGAAPER